jgi:hypothetical protein
VWSGIRTWMRSASNYMCLQREENPGGRIRYPNNHWDSFVSPKCGKRMGLTSFSDSSPRGTSGKRLIDRYFTSGAHYSICSTSIY